MLYVNLCYVVGDFHIGHLNWLNCVLFGRGQDVDDKRRSQMGMLSVSR